MKPELLLNVVAPEVERCGFYCTQRWNDVENDVAFIGLELYRLPGRSGKRVSIVVLFAGLVIAKKPPKSQFVRNLVLGVSPPG
jgi:hypothetical protein